MANTYTQVHLQLVFAVKYRAALIQRSWKDELYKYITAIIQNAGHKLLIINGMPDHVHILIGLRPAQSISDLMKHIKGDSSAWINQKKLIYDKFSWQEGYGAFSYSKDQIPRVINYIRNQEEHHRKASFLEEYRSLLREFDIEFNDQYIFVEPI